MPTRTCDICDTPIHRALAPGQPQLCLDIQCQRLHQQRTTMPPALYGPHLAFQKKLILERREQEAAKQRHRDTLNQNEEADNQRLLQAFVDTHPEAADKHINVVMIPSVSDTLLPPTPARIEAYETNLEAALKEAIACEDITELTQDQHYSLHDRRVQQDAFLAQHPHIAQVSDQLCARCRGGCCTEGNDHAFLSAVVLRRQLDADPALTPEALQQAYLDALPSESVAGSCILHGPTGCTLPRSLRSDVCNHYLCDAVRHHQTQLDPPLDPDTTLTLVIQRRNHNWNRYAADEMNPAINVMPL